MEDSTGMVDRLVTVLSAQHCGNAAAPSTALMASDKEELRSAVRALLRAMREPTSAQLAAFARVCDDDGSCLVRTGWRAMIEAAIDG